MKIFFGFKLFVAVVVITMQVPVQAGATAQTAAKKITLAQFNKAQRPLIKTDYTQILPDDSPANIAKIREVNFTNDLTDIVRLDLACQNNTPGKREEECLEHFRQIPITIRAEKEYRVNDGDEINIETKHSWELSINEISNEALLSLKTFRDIVLEHFMPKKRIPNFMDEWIWTPYNHAKIYIYQKFLAPMFKIITNKEATTTIVIVTEIEPHYDSIRCSDIILDLDKLNSENKLEISVEHENLLNMRVTIKPIKYGSLPDSFF